MVNSASNRISQFLVYALLLVFSAVFIIPLFLTVSNSLSPFFSLPTFFPQGFHIENYKLATTMIDFWKFTQNSIIICVISVTTTTLSSGLVGYAFSRIQAPGKKFLFMIVLSTMMLPGIVTQIPTFILFHKYGLLNTFYPWLIWGIGGSPFFIFLYRQFFSAIPKELEEAARIDGCSIFRTYWNIFLPLSLPVMATVSIMSFQWSWGDFIGPFMFLNEAKYPLATALSTIGYVQPENAAVVIQQLAAAASILFMLPVILLFFIGQRFLIEGVVTSGVKG
ncbi:carbohydrate ABC transporter permease [Paenibacillus sp. sptzw28]|uniref:carbohydrate ABC transporter permease n=1 Tax=Paenibacillus sp. sptzw28 TaxID=715179 RepID=UPI001C6EF39F|nr:carbohydrate ABC transporter permease [Paenibacillus sp. sptzw28]QYR22760.1 carbohydrate ABC transporter permease [Paenibacillus sp. sptzw28]